MVHVKIDELSDSLLNLIHAFTKLLGRLEKHIKNNNPIAKSLEDILRTNCTMLDIFYTEFVINITVINPESIRTETDIKHIEQRMETMITIGDCIYNSCAEKAKKYMKIYLYSKK